MVTMFDFSNDTFSCFSFLNLGQFQAKTGKVGIRNALLYIYLCGISDCYNLELKIGVIELGGTCKVCITPHFYLS